MQNEYKKYFYDIWMRGKHFKSLNESERKVYELMDKHIQYYVHFEAANTDDFDYEKSNEGNPFYHLSLHLTLGHYLQNSNFKILKDTFLDLSKYYNNHEAEHILIEAIVESLSHAAVNALETSSELLTDQINPDINILAELIKKIKNKYLK